jgi:hypothetical protein
MRITKKYAGTSCIGKQVFQLNNNIKEEDETAAKIWKELNELENLFLDRLLNKMSSSGGSSSMIDDYDDDSDSKSVKSGILSPYQRRSKDIENSLGFSKSRKFASAPDLAKLNKLHLSNSAIKGKFSKLQKSHSLMDLEQYTNDDDAAGIYSFIFPRINMIFISLKTI